MPAQAPIAPPKLILRTDKQITDFTRKVMAKKTLRDFAKSGKMVPKSLPTLDRIKTLVSTFDALEAQFNKETKLSLEYKNWERRMIEKVVDDKKTYGLENEQIEHMIDTHRNFNKFIKRAIKIVRKQEERR